jgi:hypothetical protein
MADPRTFTVKQCAPAYAAKSGAAIAGATSQRRDFFNSVGKIGDLNALNDFGGGKIGSGLRTLASVSNSIRTGCGSIPTSIGSTLDSGANWVLEHTGIGAGVVNALQGFHPELANQAYGQAKAIFQQVKSGSFHAKDIPGYLQDFQNLERLGTKLFTPSGGDVQTSLGEHCEASPYAVDLIARAPKYKFLFVVQFLPNAAYSALSAADFGPLDMAFTIKKSTRPNIKFVHDDVNYYNFRTKVATKTEFEEMTMSFHDDTMNFATQFYTAYLRAMSPITGLTPEERFNIEEKGMDFVGNTLKAKEIIKNIDGNRYSASHGLLAGDNKEIFNEIRIYHLFDFGNRMTVYRFMNPRIGHLAPDDLDMSVGNEGSELSLSFNYDSVYVDADVSLKNNGGKYNLAQTQRGAVYPLRDNSGGSNAPNNGGFNPYGPTAAPPGGTESCDPLNTINTSSAGGLFNGLGSNLNIPELSSTGSSVADKLGGFVTTPASDNLSSLFSGGLSGIDSLLG